MAFFNNRTNLSAALLCASSTFALSTIAYGQGASPETVVVTGSRVIADAANSPTPLTIVTTSQLQATTPTNLSDALNKLPVFVGSFSSHTSNGAGNNYASAALNLRDFGAQRTLVLLDGHRVTPSNSDGTVNIDTLPQMLMQRVDVVTGGASAVYGSDAVTGVVNFILDKRFSGLKFDVNSGISNYEDGGTYNIGVAAGADLFGGRGHIEGAARIYHQDGILNANRPRGGQNFLLTGTGTTASPFTTTRNATYATFAFGGKITCTGCAANGQQFIANGIVGPFNPGTTTGTGGINVGGDGAYDDFTNNTAMNSTEESFVRFSYNIDDNTIFYVQGSATQAYDKAKFLPDYINTGSGTAPNQYYANNAYLSASAQASLAGTGGTFQIAEWFNNPDRQALSMGLDNAFNVTVGVDGNLVGKYDWNIYYTHGNDRLKESDPHNMNMQRMWAANDAVSAASGNIACYVSTTTNASLYPGCVPMNPFGPTAMTDSQFNYFATNTYFLEQNTLDNVGGSISGELFDDWAGPVKVALSGEGRWSSLTIDSNATQRSVDCTGLRLCSTQTVVYTQTTVAPLPTTSENVWEVAGEVNVPLLKGLPLVQDLALDLAGRYTDYSITGSVETWKIGLDYHVNDEVRFRATNSIDIRAPTLYDLYQPVTTANTNLTDIHTNLTGTPRLQSSGNPNLVPEIARTYTGGVVFTPNFVPGLTFSIDYYNINMKDAIGSITGHDLPEQQLCESSGGTGQYCALYVRPLPFGNTTTANFPTLVYAYSLNAAVQRTEGWDIELNYGFPLSDIWQDAPGSVSLRMITNYAPVLESTPYPTGPLTFTGVKEVIVNSANTTTSKGHVTSFVAYNMGSWTFNLQDRWMAGYPRAVNWSVHYIQPRVNSVNYQDITISKKFQLVGETLSGYFSVQNIGNVEPPINLTNFQTNPGIFYGAINGTDAAIYDKIGRFFTIGVRGSF